MSIDLPDDDRVYSFLSRSLDHMLHRTDVALGPGERGRMFAWYWGYYGRAALDMFSATGQSRFASLVEDTCTALFEVRDDSLGLVDDQRGSVVPSWGTKYKSGGRSNEITTAGLITLPMFEFVRLTGIRWVADAALETLLAFRSERDEAAGARYFFRHRSEGVVEALNHSALYGASLVHAARVISDPWLMETAQGLHRYFVSFVDRRHGSVCWPYAPEPSQDPQALPSEAIWKAAATIELPVALAEAGLLSEPGLMADIANALRRHPVLLAGDLPQFLDHGRTSAVDAQKVSGGLSSLVGAFLQITDDQLVDSLLALMARRPQLFPNGWFGGSRAMIMAWAHLRRVGTITTDPLPAGPSARG